MLVQRLRRWPSIKTQLGERPVFSERSLSCPSPWRPCRCRQIGRRVAPPHSRLNCHFSRCANYVIGIEAEVARGSPAGRERPLSPPGHNKPADSSVQSPGPVHPIAPHSHPSLIKKQVWIEINTNINAHHFAVLMEVDYCRFYTLKMK